MKVGEILHFHSLLLSSIYNGNSEPIDREKYHNKRYTSGFAQFLGMSVEYFFKFHRLLLWCFITENSEPVDREKGHKAVYQCSYASLRHNSRKAEAINIHAPHEYGLETTDR